MEQICRLALLAYVTLNTLPHVVPQSGGRDYRDTRAYQYMLKTCTTSSLVSRVATLPHREFFGIPDGQFDRNPPARDPARKGGAANTTPRKTSPTKSSFCHEVGDYVPVMWEMDPRERWLAMCERGPLPYGKLPFAEFLVSEGPAKHLPTVLDVQEVSALLGALGMPMELTLLIMDFAGYSVQQKLRVAHDPLHKCNKALLEEYLDYCWKLLVRCDMLAEAAGTSIEWEPLVEYCMSCLFAEEGESIFASAVEADARLGGDGEGSAAHDLQRGHSTSCPGGASHDCEHGAKAQSGSRRRFRCNAM